MGIKINHSSFTSSASPKNTAPSMSSSSSIAPSARIAHRVQNLAELHHSPSIVVIITMNWRGHRSVPPWERCWCLASLALVFIGKKEWRFFTAQRAHLGNGRWRHTVFCSRREFVTVRARMEELWTPFGWEARAQQQCRDKDRRYRNPGT